MKVRPFPGFKSIKTHHCCTGSLKHIYNYYNHPISEDMLLGIGGGVGFIYWHGKGQMPFLGGRGKGKPADGFEVCVGERTGVTIGDFKTSSAKKAEKTMIELLEAGEPVMFQLDMGFLPYFDFGESEYHFGAHFTAAGGIDQDQRKVLMADRDEEYYEVSFEDLAKARGSTFKPFPPKNRWFTFDFSNKHIPGEAEVMAALKELIQMNLYPPISNLGFKGIRKASKKVTNWKQTVAPELLKMTMFNTHIFIDAKGGTGGGSFRYMLSRFLDECAVILKNSILSEAAQEFGQIGDSWQEAADLFKEGYEKENYKAVLPEASRILAAISEMEEAAWQSIEKVVQ